MLKTKQCAVKQHNLQSVIYRPIARA